MSFLPFQCHFPWPGAVVYPSRSCPNKPPSPPPTTTTTHTTPSRMTRLQQQPIILDNVSGVLQKNVMLSELPFKATSMYSLSRPLKNNAQDHRTDMWGPRFVRTVSFFYLYFFFFYPHNWARESHVCENDDTADVGLEFDSSESSSSIKRGGGGDLWKSKHQYKMFEIKFGPYFISSSPIFLASKYLFAFLNRI